MLQLNVSFSRSPQLFASPLSLTTVMECSLSSKLYDIESTTESTGIKKDKLLINNFDQFNHQYLISESYT